jgi:hypothetical protein
MAKGVPGTAPSAESLDAGWVSWGAGDTSSLLRPRVGDVLPIWIHLSLLLKRIQLNLVDL